ncbi:MAG TPA: response regulator [Candidatus Angelobacter sp.]|nr:response regulator [Candidatus Angelobacter sp.]
MLEINNNEILIVDDDKGVRDSLGLVLQAAGYDVTLAENGFDALLQLRRTHPVLIISDLNMPQMSGFEFLSVVRRRFPHVSVIAMSGAYHCGNTVPGGVIADAFYPKGQGVRDLLQIAAELIHTSEQRALAHQTESAPVWIPRNGKDSSGVPFVVLTCTECLRSFSLNVEKEDLQKIQETSCMFCLNTVRYIIDFSLSIVSPRREARPMAATAQNGAAKAKSEVA